MKYFILIAASSAQEKPVWSIHSGYNTVEDAARVLNRSRMIDSSLNVRLVRQDELELFALELASLTIQ